MSVVSAAHGPEARERARFPFGRNWKNYLAVLSEERIAASVASLEAMLGRAALDGATFLDVGSGSGLSSLAASRLGALRIHSFDFDRDSVACTDAIRRRYAPTTVDWTVERGSALDREYLTSLGTWDVVCSWGVLHHTGDMWRAIDAVAQCVRPGGALFLALYNDQGFVSRGWATVKRLYNTGTPGRLAVTATFVPYFVGRGILADALRLRNPWRRYRDYHHTRGMSIVHDWIDWLGGYPFEVASPDAVLDFCRARGFVLEKLKTCGGKLGCNEFVFRRASSPAESTQA